MAYHGIPCSPIVARYRYGAQGQRLKLGADVELFLSTIVNKLDKKGRVSVPASFRSVLSGQRFYGIIVYPSFVNPAIEGCGFDRMERISAGIDQFDPFSEERDAFAVSILSNSYQLPFDSEGRIMLPQVLADHANLSDRVAFVGLGSTFQIWDPEKFEIFEREARDRARSDRNVFRMQKESAPSASKTERGT